MVIILHSKGGSYMEQEIIVVTSDIIAAKEDDTTIELWLRSKRSMHTRKAYTNDINAFYAFLEEHGRSATIKGVTLKDMQDYADHLKSKHKEASTQSRKMAAVKSLLTFASKIRYIDFNVGAAQPLPEGKDKL